ncbi:hypothetical protein JXB11_00525 [Candidatus Woesearchaeota archaeon]|nr:hypothetical protein [Candidatus Woesearchaeota archaeon]
MPSFTDDLKGLLYWNIIKRKSLIPLIVMVFFILSFAVVRLNSYLFPSFTIMWREYHIHHFYFGIIFMGVAAWIALISDRPRIHDLAAILLGIGMGLTTDELGLMLTCGTTGLVCDYYARVSYDIGILILAVFLNIAYLIPFWHLVIKRVFGRRKL